MDSKELSIFDPWYTIWLYYDKNRRVEAPAWQEIDKLLLLRKWSEYVGIQLRNS